MPKKNSRTEANNDAANSLAKNLSNLTISNASSNRNNRNRNRNIAAEFGEYFGNETRLDNWKKLCRDVGVENWEQLTSIKKCKTALGPVWVNIYDFLDAIKAGKTPRRFQSEAALANYTQSTEKIFPKRRAKEGGPVRALLAHIF